MAIRPAMLYGIECWVLKSQQKSKIALQKWGCDNGWVDTQDKVALGSGG